MKYKFNKDWWGGTYVPPGAGMATRRVEFKQGDVVEGTFVHIGTQSEADYVSVTSSQGTVRIPFGGRVSVLDPVMADGGAGLRTPVVKSFFAPRGMGFGMGEKLVMLFVIGLILLIAAYFIYIVVKKGKIN